jgi:hypothetical protein
MTYKPISPQLPALLKKAAPVLLDIAGFVVIVIGTARLWGDVAWLVAGVLLVVGGYRAQSD